MFVLDTIPNPTRPRMGASYGIATEVNLDEMLTWEWVSGQMTEARSYWISSTRPDGRPHAAPVWGLWIDNVLYFSTGRTSRKGLNLAQDPHVVAHLESGDEVVIVEGRVEEVADQAFLADFAEAYHAKYAFKPDTADPAGVYYAVRPDLVLAWLEHDFVKSAVRWEF